MLFSQNTKNQHLAMLDVDDTDSLCENTDLHGFF